MVTSRLIDINTAAITYRRECLQALQKRLYTTCIGCIKTMNSLLPEDDEDFIYRIIFNDLEYNNIADSTDHIVCTHCKTEHDYNSINFEETSLSWSEQVVIQENTMMVWLCPKCDKINRLSESEVIEDVIQTPFYSRYVPNPPLQKRGLASELNFHSAMSEWVWLCLENLEESFTRFRDDNWNKDKDLDPNTSQIDTSLEDI